MFNTKKLPGIFFSLGMILFLILTGPTTGFSKISPLSPKGIHMVQTINIVKALERYHYSEKRLDDAMSARIFDEYIKQLDPGKRLITLTDLKQFKSQRFKLDTILKRGNLKLFYIIFNLYQERATQRLEYILDQLPSWKTRLSLVTDDEFIFDVDKRPRPARASELKALWRKDIINHIIGLKLDQKNDEQITQILTKIYENRLSRMAQTTSEDVFKLFINIVTESFDPHTQYFPPKASENFDIHMSLSLEGIGALLENDYEYIKVVRLIPKGPADKSKQLMPGDKIIGVGQGKTGEITDTIGRRIDEVVKLIRGPKNTYVRLKIIPAKNANTTTTISILRDKVKLKEQAAKKKIIQLPHDGKTLKLGIIEIPNFYIDFDAYHRGEKDYKSTTSDVKKLLFELAKEDIDGLIVDLRDNGGGSLKEANELTGLFLKSGPTVQIKSKNRVTRLYDEDPSISYTGPLAVIINRMSASASEIFAGAIKDYHRGIIIGTQSFGKGTVQELAPLGDGRLKLTSAKFYRVSGKSTQHRGVLPDIAMPGVYKTETTGESSLEGALLWDTIPPTRYRAYPSLAALFPELIRLHQNRALDAPELQYLSSRLKMSDDLTQKARLSLNLEKRKDENAKELQRELDIENTYLTAVGKPSISSFDENPAKINDYKGFIMKYAQLVMADFIQLTQNHRW